MKLRKTLPLFCAFLFPLSICANTNSISGTNAMPVLSPPINLYQVDVWRDGGSLGFVIGDRSAAKIQFVIDGKAGSQTRGWFFLNTTHTDYTKGIKLSLGGEEEQTLLLYLSSWLHTTFTDAELKRIAEITDFRDKPQAEFYAWHIQRLLQRRPEVLKRLKSEPSTISAGDSSTRTNADLGMPEK